MSDDDSRGLRGRPFHRTPPIRIHAYVTFYRRVLGRRLTAQASGAAATVRAATAFRAHIATALARAGRTGAAAGIAIDVQVTANHGLLENGESSYDSRANVQTHTHEDEYAPRRRYEVKPLDPAAGRSRVTGVG